MTRRPLGGKGGWEKAQKLSSTSTLSGYPLLTAFENKLFLTIA